MPEQTIQIYGAGSGGTENDLANIDIPEDGSIVGVYWSVNHGMDADAESIAIELSFVSSSAISRNDARGVISTIRDEAALTTSGVYQNRINVWHAMDIEVFSGERLHLHVSATAGLASQINALIHLDTRRRVPRRAGRRR